MEQRCVMRTVIKGSLYRIEYERRDENETTMFQRRKQFENDTKRD